MVPVVHEGFQAGSTVLFPEHHLFSFHIMQPKGLLLKQDILTPSMPVNFAFYPA